MSPDLVAREPRFAGYCAVMVNASDIYAMGGRPLAIVDALFAVNAEAAEPLLQGLADGAARFGVPIVGGHTNLHSPAPALAAAVLGRARRVLTSFDARPGDHLIAAVDLRGHMHGQSFWNASTEGSGRAAARRLRALPQLAEAGLVRAAKDISMGGLVGTALMMLEASGVGATLVLDDVPRPAGVPWEQWLLAFPSYGFLLAVAPEASARVVETFRARDIAAAVIGTADESRRVRLRLGRRGSPLVGPLARAADRLRPGGVMTGRRATAAAPDPSGHAPPGRGGPVRGVAVSPRGDLHWDAISQRLGVASDDIRGDDRQRLYPTVVALRARYTAPLSAARENDLFDGSVEMVPCGGACAHGRVSAAVGSNRLSVELVTTFAARQPDGWHAHGASRGAIWRRCWEPGSAPSRLALLARAARRRQPLDDAFAGPSLDPPGPALGRVRHQPSPYADYNGARLLYFAAYPTIADTAERQVVTELGLASRRTDWALAASPIARDVFYYGNLPLGDGLLVDVLAFDPTEDGVKTRVRLRRRARPRAHRGRDHAPGVRRRRSRQRRFTVKARRARPGRGSIGIFTYSTLPRGSVVHAAALADALTDAGWSATLVALDKDGRGFFRPLRAKLALIPAAPAPATTAALVRLRAGEIAGYLATERAGVRPAPRAGLPQRQRPPGGARPGRSGRDDQDRAPRRALCRSRADGLPGAIDPRGGAVPDRQRGGARATSAATFGIGCPVVGNGVDVRRFQGVEAERLAAWRARLGGGGPIVLSVGGIEARKNSLRILLAFTRLRRRYPQARLWILGGATVLDHGAARAEYECGPQRAARRRPGRRRRAGRRRRRGRARALPPGRRAGAAVVARGVRAGRAGGAGRRVAGGRLEPPAVHRIPGPVLRDAGRSRVGGRHRGRDRARTGDGAVLRRAGRADRAQAHSWAQVAARHAEPYERMRTHAGDALRRSLA